jgi:ubiquinone/menaquinone biosynthesis C-methylase UbiE
MPLAMTNSQINSTSDIATSIQAWLRRLVGGHPTTRLLEVGCGTGHWLNVMTDLLVELVGIDPSRSMLERSHARATRAQLVCATAESMPFQA